MPTYHYTRRITEAVPPVATLTAALSRHSIDGPLVLDLEHPAVRAVLALYAALRPVDDTPGRGFAGPDTLAVLHGWFEGIGLDPAGTIDELNMRIARTSGPHTRRPRAATDPHLIDDVNLDRVAEHVRAAGVDCEISTPGCGVAVLQAGPPPGEGSDVTAPWKAIARPGRYGWDDMPSTATTRALFVGPDDLGDTVGIDVRAVGALTEPDIAALIVAQTLRDNPAEPLTAADIAALGFDPRGLDRR